MKPILKLMKLDTTSRMMISNAPAIPRQVLVLSNCVVGGNVSSFGGESVSIIYPEILLHFVKLNKSRRISIYSPHFLKVHHPVYHQLRVLLAPEALLGESLSQFYCASGI